MRTEVFFHVGLGKTATKFLQFDFFPFIRGVIYIPPNLWRVSHVFVNLLVGKKILISREFDVQLEDEFSRFLSRVGGVSVYPILIVRRHDEWILSQFKRFVKNGHHITFDEFFNFRDTGIFKLKDLCFRKKFEFLKEASGNEPLLLTYDLLREKPGMFFDAVLRYIGAEADKIKVRKRHVSYSEKQVKFAYFVSGFLNFLPPAYPSLTSTFRKYLFVYPIRYSVLWLGKVLPEVSADIFPTESVLERIKAKFADDWEFCLEVERRWILNLLGKDIQARAKDENLKYLKKSSFS